MAENPDLINRIREIAEEVIPLSVRGEVLKNVMLIARETEEKIALILKAMPGANVSLDGQIKSRLLEVLHSDRIMRAAYERYKTLLGEENCYNFADFSRYGRKSRESVIASPYLQFLEVESKGLKPGIRIQVDLCTEVFTVHKINREGRVILAGKNNRGIKPSSCFIYEEGK
jgi:hypothetical protein